PHRKGLLAVLCQRTPSTCHSRRNPLIIFDDQHLDAIHWLNGSARGNRGRCPNVCRPSGAPLLFQAYPGLTAWATVMPRLAALFFADTYARDRLESSVHSCTEGSRVTRRLFYLRFSASISGNRFFSVPLCLRGGCAVTNQTASSEDHRLSV